MVITHVLAPAQRDCGARLCKLVADGFVVPWSLLELFLGGRREADDIIPGQPGGSVWMFGQNAGDFFRLVLAVLLLKLGVLKSVRNLDEGRQVTPNTKGDFVTLHHFCNNFRRNLPLKLVHNQRAELAARNLGHGAQPVIFLYICFAASAS